MQKTESLKHDCLGLAILLGVALAIGVYLIATSVLISKDGIVYIRQAQTLADSPLAVAGQYPIGYPFLLFVGHKVASLFAPGDSTAVWIVSSQAVTLLCRMGALVFLYLSGKILVGTRRSFWAVLILVVLPYPAHYGCDVLREWPYLLSLSAGFWLLLVALRDEKGWMFGLVGLAAGLGALVRPSCGQLVVYGLLGLVVVGKRWRCRSAWPEAGLFLLVGFALVATPYSIWTGTAVPHQLRSVPFDSAPVIMAVGGKSASEEPLSFDVGPGESFEATIEASDPEGNALTLSVVTVPLETRPVYRFRSSEQAADFWTVSGWERDWLGLYLRDVWDGEGIDYYAYAQADAAPELEPIYRLWSPVLIRHFYTISDSERQAMLESASPAQWESEGVAFYAFREGYEPAGTIPVYRFRGDVGCHFWTVQDAETAMRRFPGEQIRADGIAWYVYPAGAAPTGSVLEGPTFRWRPASQQQGVHQLNVIASDGRLQSCQLVRLAVNAAGAGQVAELDRSPVEVTPRTHADPAEVPATVQHVDGDRSGATGDTSAGAGPSFRLLLLGAGDILGGVSENLMIFFFVPLCVGLYHRLRYVAWPRERMLTVAIVAVNLGLMLARHMWIEPGVTRRYCLGLVALTIWYVPAGLAQMARLLRLASDRVFGDRGQADLGERVWFVVLVVIGMAVCGPKLLTPMGADKKGYRETARWLREHTGVDDVIGVPDRRISFYADRQGSFYQEHPDPRRIGYAVTFVDNDSSSCAAADWSEAYSCWINERHRGKIVVYRMP
jgi:Repeat of unknown function (DUF5648)/Dolichyl-phosphate-mannose-protein mannosyltransferase